MANLQRLLVHRLLVWWLLVHQLLVCGFRIGGFSVCHSQIDGFGFGGGWLHVLPQLVVDLSQMVGIFLVVTKSRK